MSTPGETFRGHIGDTYRESTPWWPDPNTPPAGAPNILFIVLDDVGFSDLGCYGSEISTPHVDALAAGGLRYNNFHVTAMCSPTRACLLTGRNAHSVGVGAIAEWSNGFPGYEGRISLQAATAAEIFAEHGYGTYAVGKWHLSNLANYGVAGPHDHWPLGRGFSRWYGFLGGYVDHWHPDLHEDNHPIRHVSRPGYHLSEDLVDHAISQIRDHVGSAGGRPFFQYLAFGAAHWPHHVPADYIARYDGRYQVGWDVIREERIARQKALGIVPAHTVLAPRNAGVDAWSTLSADARRLSARLQQTYAAFMEHTDAQIGRLIDFLSSIDQLHNTAVVVLSDNGASGEGGPTGAVNIRKHMLTEKETVAEGLSRLDEIGGERSFPHYSFGWAQVSNTPLKWYKKGTHGGGIRAPLIMHWPSRIKRIGEIRSQYHHVIDVLPTFLDPCGMKAPEIYRGVAQIPIHGLEMAYTFDQADAPTRKEIQHFEIVGDRALWRLGWKAVARHRKGEAFDNDRWELYKLDDDFSECHDRAAEEPELLRTLVDQWWSEARKYGVLPLDDRETERAFDWFSNHVPTRYEYLPGTARADRLMIPPISDRDFRITAEVEVPSSGASGVLLACGNRFGGFVLHVRDDSVVFDYLYTENRTYTLRSPLTAGSHLIVLDFAHTEDKAGASGTALRAGGRFALSVNGAPAATMHVPHTWTTYGITAGVTCGYSNVPITDDCIPPSIFTGNLSRVSLEVVDVATGPSVDPFSALLQGE